MEYIKIKANNECGFYDLIGGGVIDITYPTSKTRRARVQENGLICPTITANGVLAIMEIENPKLIGGGRKNEQ